MHSCIASTPPFGSIQSQGVDGGTQRVLLNLSQALGAGTWIIPLSGEHSSMMQSTIQSTITLCRLYQSQVWSRGIQENNQTQCIIQLSTTSNVECNE